MLLLELDCDADEAIMLMFLLNTFPKEGKVVIVLFKLRGLPFKFKSNELVVAGVKLFAVIWKFPF